MSVIAKRVWHQGASRLLGCDDRTFEEMLTANVDMVEIDVMMVAGRLLVAHDCWSVLRGRAQPLGEVLSRMADPRFAHVEFNVDVKVPGYERELVAALRRHRVLDRSLISSQHARCLDLVRSLAPEARVGISVGGRLSRARHRWDTATLNDRVGRALSSGRFHAIMAEHSLVCRELVETVTAAGGELYAWTVNDVERVRRLRDIGVFGLISDDMNVLAV